MKHKKQMVSLTTLTLKEIFGRNIIIPEYQRIYCWKEKNVYQLWQDILTLEDNKPYHLGSVIFHKKEENYDIVDGQQRLITLALIVKELDMSSSNPLLKQKLSSQEAEKYIAYNSFLIRNYIANISNENNSNENKKLLLTRILTNIQLAVLEISSDTLDLAYTFFSNQNSKGKALSDYNLLKAHHLRFVTLQEQAIHVATRWDMLTNSNDETGNSEADLERTLGIYLFRLRKWMRKRDWNENSKYRVKTEFEKAMTIAEIPPFGEQFYFYEKIQGGTHFFAYAEYFVHQFKIFRATPQAKALIDNLGWESHWYYKDCIEAFLFAYYLKFGTMYLTEALVCIEKVISWHRYSVNRAMLYKILEYAKLSETVMIIDQSTSPTFFLAEMLHKIKTAGVNTYEAPIKQRYLNCTQQIYRQLGVETINVNEIKQLVNGK